MSPAIPVAKKVVKPFGKRLAGSLKWNAAFLGGLGLMTSGPGFLLDPVRKARAVSQAVNRPIKLGSDDAFLGSLIEAALVKSAAPFTWKGLTAIPRAARSRLKHRAAYRRGLEQLRTNVGRQEAIKQRLMRRRAGRIAAGESLPEMHGRRVQGTGPEGLARGGTPLASSAPLGPYDEKRRISERFRKPKKGRTRSMQVRRIGELTAALSVAGAVGGIAEHGIESALHSARTLRSDYHYRKMLASNPNLAEYDDGKVSRAYMNLIRLAPSVAKTPDLAAIVVERQLQSKAFTPEMADALARLEESIAKSRRKFVRMPGVENYYPGLKEEA